MNRTFKMSVGKFSVERRSVLVKILTLEIKFLLTFWEVGSFYSMINTLHEFQAAPVKKTHSIIVKNSIIYFAKQIQQKSIFGSRDVWKQSKSEIRPTLKPSVGYKQSTKSTGVLQTQQDRDGGLGVGFCRALAQYFGGRIFVCGVLGTVEQ